MTRTFLLTALLALSACGQTSVPTSGTATVTTAATTKPATEGTAVTESVNTSAPIWDPASARSWDRNLLALMPQIDACMARAPHLGIVSYAGHDQDGVLVVLHGEEVFDCRVANNQAHIGPHTSRPPGDGEAEFVRGPGPNPGGECYTAPEVRDASGHVLGWMIDPEGC